MAQPNRISLAFSSEKKARIQSLLESLAFELMPDLITLSGDERQEILKMGDKSVPFVRKSAEYAHLYPDLVPGYMDLKEMEIDFDASEYLRGLGQQLRPLLGAIDDTRLLSGSEAFQAALLFYRNVHAAAASGASVHAAAVYEDLSKRFPGGPTKSKTPPTE